MRRRVVRAGLVGVLAASAALASVSPAGGVAGFGDVPAGSYYAEAVQWMSENDITTGTSLYCFSPTDPVTRGQAAAFMWRMEGEPDAPPHPFDDVTSSWQQGPVSWMYANAITTGTSATTYSPEDTLTRGQLAALLYRLAGNPEGSPPHSFDDVVSPWQQDAVSWMSDLGITTGTTPSTFSPGAKVTRGQLAAFFYRYKDEPFVVVRDWTPPHCSPHPVEVLGVEVTRDWIDSPLFETTFRNNYGSSVTAFEGKLYAYNAFSESLGGQCGRNPSRYSVNLDPAERPGSVFNVTLRTLCVDSAVRGTFYITRLLFADGRSWNNTHGWE